MKSLLTLISGLALALVLAHWVPSPHAPPPHHAVHSADLAFEGPMLADAHLPLAEAPVIARMAFVRESGVSLARYLQVHRNILASSRPAAMGRFAARQRTYRVPDPGRA